MSNPNKQVRFLLQTLVLLTALAAFAFFAYTKHIQTLRLTVEVEMLRKRLTLERDWDMLKIAYAKRHPRTVRLEKQIAEVDAEGTKSE